MNLNSYEGDLLNKSESDNDNSYVTLYKQLNNLRKISMFREISDSKLISIIRVMRKEAFEKGMTIVKEGQDGDKFYLIVKGKVKITKNGNFLRMYEEGNCFGEVSLLENCIRTATVTAQSDCICWVLSKNYFNTVIDSTLKEYLTKKMALINSNISLEELYYIKFLGQGKFGSVDLVHNGKNIYAVKRISKAAVEKDDYLISYLLNERRIMLCLDHPFIIKLVKTLKDRSNCYYLMEYIPGECLEFHLDNRRSSNKKSSSPITSTIYHTQFYTASLLLVLNYLNNKNIAHRDLKPSNIMVDRNGYLKLIDFGTAKIIRDYTDTVIGTPHYIAPEVISGKGYSITLDYWSLGIMLYEMVYGVLPFAHNANQVMDIYKAILFSGFRLLEGNEFKFSDSDDVSVDDVNQLLKTLLQKKHSKRICNFKELKGFSFFKNFNFVRFLT